jgi:hypothetical protein
MLSANFAAFREAEEYQVLNENNATIGVLLDDGIELTLGDDAKVYAAMQHSLSKLC